MGKFSSWSRENLESVAEEMLDALLRAKQWIENDEATHGRQFWVGNEVREVVKKTETREVVR